MPEEKAAVPSKPVETINIDDIDSDSNGISHNYFEEPKEIPDSGKESTLVSEHNTKFADHIAEAESATEEAEDKLKQMKEEDEVLEPLVDAKRWIIGKPPEHQGKSTEYSVYWQRPLGFMARNRFIALVTKTLSTSIRATGGDIGGMSDVFGEGDGTIVERGKRLREHDFKDASSFFALAMELIGYTPEFLSECYCLFLDVPPRERGWFKEVIEYKYDPENDQWGLSEEAGLEMIELFIHQNYEDMRRFFLERLPKIAKRVSQIERAREEKQQGRLQPSKS